MFITIFIYSILLVALGYALALKTGASNDYKGRWYANGVCWDTWWVGKTVRQVIRQNRRMGKDNRQGNSWFVGAGCLTSEVSYDKRKL